LKLPWIAVLVRGFGLVLSSSSSYMRFSNKNKGNESNESRLSLKSSTPLTALFVFRLFLRNGSQASKRET
jgi:hypothetical protein